MFAQIVSVFSDDYCPSRSFDYDSAGLAGLEATCADCAGSSGCGFCLSTGACLRGDPSGPLSGSPCPTWLGDSASCPKEPVCEDHRDCGGCVSDESCAWCASEQRCLDLSEIFTSDCHGTIFDAPCPASWVPETRVVGDFILEPDGLFGGGHLQSSGTTFELLVSDEAVSLISAGDVQNVVMPLTSHARLVVELHHMDLLLSQLLLVMPWLQAAALLA